MCYSVAGRVQTRLAALSVPALLALLLAWLAGDQRYVTMVIIMALVVLDLDLSVYPRILDYQARWQTYLLGLGEFALTLGIVRWLAGSLPLSDIIWFYVVSWIGGQLIVNVLLPMADPFWMEHGGEIGRPGIVSSERAGSGVGGLLSRAWQQTVRASPDTLALGMLLSLTILQWTVLPSTLEPLQMGTAIAGALAVGWLSRRLGASSAPGVSGFLILGLLVSLLLRGPGLWPYLLAGALAAGARSWLRIADHPLFNGAAFGVLAAVAGARMYTSDTQWGSSLLLPLVLANGALFLAWRARRLPLVLAFSAVVLAHGVILAFDRHLALQVALPQVLPTYLIFLAGFVLLETATTPSGTAGQICTGLAVAALGLALQQVGMPLPFLAALMICTYVLAFLIPLRSAISQTRASGYRQPGAPGIHELRSRIRVSVGRHRRSQCAAASYIQAGGGARAAETAERGTRAAGRCFAGPPYSRRPSSPLQPEQGPECAEQQGVRGLSRRSFLSAVAALGGGFLLGGGMRQLASLDPALLSLPADPVLARGRAIPRFREVAAQAGIALRHGGDPGEGSPAIGTGVAWGDYDGDGRLDLYVTDHMGACHLYRNNGDGTFTDVAEQAGVAHPAHHATSAVFVDYDNDGRLDLYVGAAFGPNVLYHNNGDGTFTDVTATAALGDRGRTMSTAWGDYDGDGYLDVFVANYPDQAITFEANSTPNDNTRTVLHMPHPDNKLYHNNGDGTFSDVTHLLGDQASWGFGFSAVWFDYNNDGRPDLYVAYDFGRLRQPNTLWRNDGPGGPHGWRFTQVQEQMDVDTQANPMGIASGDYDNDGWLDLAVTNIGPNLLYRNLQGRSFRDMAQRAGVTHANEIVTNMMNPSMTWGVSFADLNNDGWLDLYLVGGAMDYQNIPQPNRLFLNDHAGGFIDVSAASGSDDPGQGRSVAVGDYDGDGYLDMFVANYGQPPRLYRNLSRDSGYHWLRLELEGTRSNRDAAGARVTVFARGLRPQTQEVQIGQGLGSCNDKALHFGLADVTEIDRVEIRWPSGQQQTIRAVPIDRVVRVREPGRSRWIA